MWRARRRRALCLTASKSPASLSHRTYRRVTRRGGVWPHFVSALNASVEKSARWKEVGTLVAPTGIGGAALGDRRPTLLRALPFPYSSSGRAAPNTLLNGGERPHRCGRSAPRRTPRRAAGWWPPRGTGAACPQPYRRFGSARRRHVWWRVFPSTPSSRLASPAARPPVWSSVRTPVGGRGANARVLGKSAFTEGPGGALACTRAPRRRSRRAPHPSLRAAPGCRCARGADAAFARRGPPP